MWDARNPRWLLVAVAVVALGIQFVPVDKTNPPEEAALTIEASTQMTPEVQDILKRACMDCHSNRTRWPWYSRVAPMSWLVADDVEHARGHYNLSEWGKLSLRDAEHTLDEMCGEVEEGFMPLASYQWMHPEARLSDADVQTLCDWTAEERGRIRAAMENEPLAEERTEETKQEDDGHQH